MRKKDSKSAEIIPENFQNPYSNGSMVIRVEDLLSGKKYEELNKIASGLYDKYNEIFSERLDVYLDAYSKLPPIEQDAEYMEYLRKRDLLMIPAGKLTLDQKYEIYCMYMDAINSVENHMSRLTIIPNPDPLVDEGYVFEDICDSKSIMDVLQKKLMTYMPYPERVFLEERIALYGTQIEINNECKNSKICLSINRDVFFRDYGKIIKILQKLKKKTGKTIELVIDFDEKLIEPNTYKRRVPYSYSQDEFEKVSVLKDSGLVDKLYFSEFKTETFMPFRREQLWSSDEVLAANKNKQNVINKLRPLKLSPFEKILGVHKHVSGHYYSGVATSSERTRTFLTATSATSEQGANSIFAEGKGFVCTSFSSYAKALIDEFGDKNIECKFINLQFYDKVTKRKKVSATHQVLLVHLKDEKYDIDGYYIWDPTWDGDNDGFSHCLFPVEDLENYRENKIAVVDEDLQIARGSVFLFNPRNDVLTENKPNAEFNKKYAQKSRPIPILTYRQGLSEVYKKAQKFAISPEILGQNTAKRSEDENVKQDFTDTIQNITTFDPESATSSFYRAVRDFYMSNEKDFPNWKENWKEYIRGGKFMY